MKLSKKFKNMNEIIEKIQKIRAQRKELEFAEIQLLANLEQVRYDIPYVYKEFIKLKRIESFETLEQKKLFVYVCASMYCPSFMIGDRIKTGVRNDIAKYAGLSSPRISNIITEVRFLYSHYKGFKTEADYLYSTIKNALIKKL